MHSSASNRANIQSMKIMKFLVLMVILMTQLVGCATVDAPDSPTLTVAWPLAHSEECFIDTVSINGRLANRSYNDKSGRSPFKAKIGDNNISARLIRSEHGSSQAKVTMVDMQVFMAPNGAYELHVSGNVNEGRAYIHEANSTNIVAASSAKWTTLFVPAPPHAPLQ